MQLDDNTTKANVPSNLCYYDIFNANNNDENFKNLSLADKRFVWRAINQETIIWVGAVWPNYYDLTEMKQEHRDERILSTVSRQWLTLLRSLSEILYLTLRYFSIC